MLFLVISCNKEPLPNTTEKEVEIDLRQYYMGDNDFTYVTGCDIVNGITVFIDPCFAGTPYAAAIPAALQRYNDAPTILSYVIVNNAAAADLVFDCVEGGCCGCANAAFPDPNNPGDGVPNQQTTFPSGGTLGSGIALNVNWTNCPCTNAELDQCFFMHTVMHEIAHTLGYYHNDQTGVSPVHVDGTPTGFDPGSIINSGPGEVEHGTFCEGSCDFNHNDIKALQALYPCDRPEIFGPDDLCVNEEGQYCLPEDLECADISWFGHPDINGSTDRCVTLSYDQSGTDFIYADVEIGGCIFYSIVQEINIGAPNILDDLTVVIDPCLHIINIDGGNPSFTYDWTTFDFSYNANPHVSINNNRVSVRAPLKTGEEFCFNVQATSDCGTASLPCEVCYTIPPCNGKSKQGIAVQVNPNNACFSESQCPDGYTCEDGICCEEGIIQGDMCVDDDHCPTGFECVFGNCCHILTGTCL